MSTRIEPIYLTWLNYLGGFEYFLFTREKDYNINIIESLQTSQNIFPDWPNSYGLTADTIDKDVYTKAKNSIFVRSQHLTKNQVEALSYIKISPVVQIINSRIDRRTVLVDKDSFKKYSESERLFTTQFAINYTDDIPAQSL
jgi:hypothetical protein